ncbi:MAG TPA: hypothetical protein VGD22_04715 [Sphingobacteriaceae bacterium]
MSNANLPEIKEFFTHEDKCDWLNCEEEFTNYESMEARPKVNWHNFKLVNKNLKISYTCTN